tara:strand:- start:35 stop:397 length:363 start_codon:yes stop_codon:yes gene_type:complete
MNAELCMCGATDCQLCHPNQPTQPTARHYELALESVVETVMGYGQWPHKGKAEFDLYEFLLDERDSSYMLEMYVASMSSNKYAFTDRIERERNTVQEMLEKHFKDSNIVAELAAEYASES